MHLFLQLPLCGLLVGILLDKPKGFPFANKQILKSISQKVIPGRVSLLVTLFLSLTALLVSTISSSPEVTTDNHNDSLGKPEEKACLGPCPNNFTL